MNETQNGVECDFRECSWGWIVNLCKKRIQQEEDRAYNKIYAVKKKNGMKRHVKGAASRRSTFVSRKELTICDALLANSDLQLS